MPPKMPEFTPEKWDKWLKDKNFAEERVEHLEDELDKALDEQEKLSHAAEELRGERDSEKRLRVQAENDARRAKAAADQAAAAAAAASRSLKIGEKQVVSAGKEGEAQELRVEMQQLKAKNHGLNTQMDALAADHERLGALLATADKDKASMVDEAAELRGIITTLETKNEEATAAKEAKESEWGGMTAALETAKAEAASLEAQNHRLGDELDRLAATSGGSKSKPAKDAVSAADLAAAVKARGEAEEHSTMLEGQLSALQTEIRTAREELAALQDETELKASAAREGLAAADAQTVAAADESNRLRVELSELREEMAAAAAEQKEHAAAAAAKQEGGLAAAVAGHEAKLAALRAEIVEANCLRKEAEERAVAAEDRAKKLEADLSASSHQAKKLETELSASKHEGTTDQLLEMMTLVKDAETAKRAAEDELAERDAKIVEMEKKHAEQLAARDESHQANGERSLDLESKSNGREAVSNGEDWAAKAAVQREELDDLHAMLDNVSAERDAALNDLRRAGDGGGGVSGDGGGDGAEEEVLRLRRECDQLRDQVSEMEDGEVPPPGSKRIKSLEDQVERLSEEHTNQTETWRTLSSQMEADKEELSQELISAKLQVAQLFMEVDGLKLRHRKATIAATAAHALQLDTATAQSSPSSSKSSSKSRPPSPASPHTMEL